MEEEIKEKEEKKTIMVEAIGARKGIGIIKFGKIDGWAGDVAEMKFDDAKRLLASQERRPKNARQFREAKEVRVYRKASNK